MSQDLREFEGKLRQWRVNFVCRADRKLCEEVLRGFYYYNQTLLWPIQDADIEVVVDDRLRNRAETRVLALDNGRFRIQIAFPRNLADLSLAYHEAAHPMQDVAAWLYFGKRPIDLPSGLVEALAEAARNWLANKTGLMPAYYPHWEKRRELAEQLLKSPDMPPEPAYAHWPAFLIREGDLRDLIKASVDVGEYRRYYEREYGGQSAPPTVSTNAQTTNATSVSNAQTASKTAANVAQTPTGPISITPTPITEPPRVETISGEPGSGLKVQLQLDVPLADWYLKLGEREYYIGKAPRREGKLFLAVGAPGDYVQVEDARLYFTRKCEGDKCYVVPMYVEKIERPNYTVVHDVADVKAEGNVVKLFETFAAAPGGKREVATVDAEKLAQKVREWVRGHPEFGLGMYEVTPEWVWAEPVGKLVIEAPPGVKVQVPGRLYVPGTEFQPKILTTLDSRVAPGTVDKPIFVEGRAEIPVYAKRLTFDDLQKLLSGQAPDSFVVLVNNERPVTPDWAVGGQVVARGNYTAVAEARPGPPDLVRKYATESGRFVVVVKDVEFLDPQSGTIRRDTLYYLYDVEGDKGRVRYVCDSRGCRETARAEIIASIAYPAEIWQTGNAVWRGDTTDLYRILESGERVDLKHGQGEPVPELSQPSATSRSGTAQPYNVAAPNTTTAPPQISVTQRGESQVASTAAQSGAPQLDLGKVAEELKRGLAGAPQWLAQGFADFFRIQAENAPKFFKETGQFIYAVGADVASKAAEVAKAAASQVISVVQNLAASTAAKAQTIPPELEREDVEERQAAPAKPREFSALPSVTALRRAAAVETPRRPVDYVVEEQKRREEQPVAQRAEERRQRDESERYVRKLAAEARTEKPREESPQQGPRQEGARKEESRPPPQVMRKLAKLQPV